MTCFERLVSYKIKSILLPCGLGVDCSLFWKPYIHVYEKYLQCATIYTNNINKVGNIVSVFSVYIYIIL